MPKRRFRFGLGTLFVLIAVAAPALAWTGYSLEWIRDRKQALSETPMFPDGGCMMLGSQDITAPGWLWLFGETGRDRIETLHASPEQVERLKHLFPESLVFNFAPMKRRRAVQQ
ncbi:MAG TPA: hypothetical protein VGG64_07050 [Pirellulales bacterium]